MFFSDEEKEIPIYDTKHSWGEMNIGQEISKVNRTSFIFIIMKRYFNAVCSLMKNENEIVRLFGEPQLLRSTTAFFQYRWG